MRSLLLCLALLACLGCGLSEMGKKRYEIESDIPLPEHKTMVATPVRVVRGDCAWDKMAFELGVGLDEWAATLDRELVEKKGWTRKPHGSGFLYRSDRYEVMLIKAVRNQEQKVEMRVAVLRQGAKLPEGMVTVDI